MATLAVSALGAGIGGLTGIGANVGWIVGGIIGNLLFPPDPVKVEGPRLGDLSVSSSAYGAPRAIGYGTVRMAGNIIWSNGIREQKDVKKEGGKGMGGPETETTTYSYYATFALAIGEGPATEVLRIWADGKIIHDKRVTQTGTGRSFGTGIGSFIPATSKPGIRYRFYAGTSTQTADAAIIADKGVANTPAFRDTVYILFDDIPLEDYGNRIPNINVEVSYETDNSGRYQHTSTELGTTTLTGHETDVVAVDFTRNNAYYLETGTGGGISKVNLWNQSHDRDVLAADSLSDGSGAGGTGGFVGPALISQGGHLIALSDDSGGAGDNSNAIVALDPTTMAELNRFGTSNASTIYSTTNAGRAKYMMEIRNPSIAGGSYLVHAGFFGDYGIVNIPSMDYVWDSDTFLGGVNDVRVWGMAASKLLTPGEGYVLSGNTYSGASSADVNITKIVLGAHANYVSVGGDPTLEGGQVFFEHLTMTPGDLLDGETDLKGVGPMVYDDTDDTLIILVSEGSGTDDYWVKWDPASDTKVWQSEAVLLSPGGNSVSMIGNSILQDGSFGYINGNNGVLMDTTDGSLEYNDTAPDWVISEGGTGSGIFDSKTQSFVGYYNGTGTSPMIRFFWNRTDPNGTSLQEIVEDLSTRAGLADADVDGSDLSAITVPGYFIGRQASARAAIEPLATLYLFDGIETDFVLKYMLRGQSSIRSLTEADLAIVNTTSGDVLKENRTQEVELPLRFSLTYMDTSNDYQQNNHSARRIAEPDYSMRSKNEVGLQINAVLDSSVAKQQAEKVLYSSWIERDNYEFKWSWANLDLDPSDVVTVTLDNGTVLTARISSADVGDTFTIDVTGVSQEAATFVSSAVTADAGQGFFAQGVIGSYAVSAWILDVPLLRDVDEPPSRAFNPVYYFMSGYAEDQFSAGALYKSSDDISYSNIGGIVSDQSWGATTNAMPDPPWDNPHATDNVSTLNVVMNVGAADMVSITNLEMLNNGNTAALIKTNGEIEIINFQTVTQESDGSFTLSVFLRGRRGTDTMSFDHTAGEIFLLLPGTKGDITPMTIAELDTLVYFKAVARGQVFEQGESLTLTSNHRALMPYAPHAITATEDGSNNTDFAWERRTRVSGALRDDYGTVPLNEDSEEYEIDILDGPGGSVVRTATGLTTPAYEYTNANQVTDFGVGAGTIETPITVKVYQVSAQAGRGFSQEITLDVQ